MRSYEDYRKILHLWETGHNKLQIATLTGIPRPTVRDIIARYGSVTGLEQHLKTEKSPENTTLAFQILQLWEGGTSQVEIAEVTGYSRYLVSACIEKFRSLRGLENHIQKFGCVEKIQPAKPIRHTHIRTTSYDDEALRDAIATSISLRQALLKLGLKPAGGNYQTLKKRIHKLKLDTSHFRGKGWLKDRKSVYVRKRPLADILVENSTYSSSNNLRQRLLNEGIFDPVCTSCGLDTWLNQPIPLELDHINGDRRDNRLENLRLLCPNCHALTETYRGKNIQLETTL